MRAVDDHDPKHRPRQPAQPLRCRPTHPTPLSPSVDRRTGSGQHARGRQPPPIAAVLGQEGPDRSRVELIAPRASRVPTTFPDAPARSASGSPPTASTPAPATRRDTDPRRAQRPRLATRSRHHQTSCRSRTPALERAVGTRNYADTNDRDNVQQNAAGRPAPSAPTFGRCAPRTSRRFPSPIPSLRSSCLPRPSFPPR